MNQVEYKVIVDKKLKTLVKVTALAADLKVNNNNERFGWPKDAVILKSAPDSVSNRFAQAVAYNNGDFANAPAFTKDGDLPPVAVPAQTPVIEETVIEETVIEAAAQVEDAPEIEENDDIPKIEGAPKKPARKTTRKATQK